MTEQEARQRAASFILAVFPRKSWHTAMSELDEAPALSKEGEWYIELPSARVLSDSQRSFSVDCRDEGGVSFCRIVLGR